MGCCWCKKKENERITCSRQQNTTCRSVTPVTPTFYLQVSKAPDPALVDRLILETLGIIATLVDNEQDPPAAMVLLHNIADHEEGFIQVVKSMINVIPLTDPLGPSIITLLLHDCPLPSKESVFRVIECLNLSKTSAIYGRLNPTRERNVCVVLGCIAETLAGPRNLKILNKPILDYLMTNLETDTDPNVMLFSLIALEKFAQSSHNKEIIMNLLINMKPCPLFELEGWYNETQFVKRQVGFCVKWMLDNIFVMKDREFTYLTVNMQGINAMLNTSDVSEYLKISPDGLEARCDAYSFESVRCTAQVDSGIWYYEVLIITSGVMQIGWATKTSNFLNHDGYGIGDDRYSIAYDGCRKLIWYNAKSEPQNIIQWKSGDILGCLLNLDTYEIMFFLNGISLPTCTQVFNMAKSGFFAAASFMSFQQCRFNFGSEPFIFPPDIKFSSFNDEAQLDDDSKIVMPRHIVLKQLRQQNIREDSCTLCYDQKASVRLVPCDHSGFCINCVSQLTECPMCRTPIEDIVEESH